VIFGGTWNAIALVAVPAAVVTVMEPVVAEAGTVAEISVPERTVKTAVTPWNLTAVAPVKVNPVTVTTVPAGALAGVKLVIVGVTLNAVALTPEPTAVVTVNSPVDAVAGTTALTFVSETIVKLA